MRLDELLKERNSAQKDLSAYIGLTTPQILANWKQRGSMPSADIAVKIAQFLGTTVEYLVTGEETNIYKKSMMN